MKVIALKHPYQKEQIEASKCVLALGYFDGLHLGHQHVIKQAKMIAARKKQKLAVMSFNQHPSIVFSKHKVMHCLTNLAEKTALLEQLGVDIFYVIDFTSKFSKLTPEAFVDQYIVGLHASCVVAGFDYSFGQAGRANMQDLQRMAQGRFDVVVSDKMAHCQEKISSTAIRQALAQGDIDKANQLLGRAYVTAGVVAHGDARGRQLGYPTANVVATDNTLIPGEGIYAVRCLVDNQWYDAMASIGRNITFESDRPITVEVNIFDFDQDIYGESVKIAWYTRLRSEIKFSSIDALVAQLAQDKQQSQAYFEALI